MTQLYFRDGKATEVKAISDIPGLITSDLRPFDGSVNGLGKAYKQSIWAYRAITLKADMLAGIPLKCWREDAEGNEEEVPDHPLMGDEALGYGATRTLRDVELALDIYGRAYLWPQPGTLGATLALKWLNPRAMKPKKDPATQQIVGYEYKPNQGTDAGVLDFKLDELITFSLFDPESDWGGLSPLAVAVTAAGADVSTVKYVESFFANSARPDGILATDQTLNEADVKRIQSWWDRLFRGVRNQFRTAVTWGGLKWTPMQAATKDTALPEVREEIRTDICVALGVPPALVISNQKYSNYEQARKSIYHETLMPRCDYITDELNRQLVKKFYAKDGVYLAHDFSEIEALQEDATARYTRAGLALQSGGRLNDALHLMGLDLIEGDEGERRYMVSGIKPLELVNNPPPPPPAFGGPAQPGPEEAEDDDAAEQEAETEPEDLPAKRSAALSDVRAGKTVTLWGVECHTPGEVRAAFQKHWPKPAKADTLAVAVAELKRFNDIYAAAR